MLLLKNKRGEALLTSFSIQIFHKFIHSKDSHKYHKLHHPHNTNLHTLDILHDLNSYNHFVYLQLIIPQYFISNKSGIWSLSLIVHSKG